MPACCAFCCADTMAESMSCVERAGASAGLSSVATLAIPAAAAALPAYPAFFATSCAVCRPNFDANPAKNLAIAGAAARPIEIALGIANAASFNCC